MTGRAHPSQPAASPAPFAPERARFEAFLRHRKLKVTGERLSILDAVLEELSHFDAESLSARLRTRGGDISRATVYRTLDLLVQCGILRKSNLGSSHANYEALREDEHHDHLICLACNRVQEFFRPDLEHMQDEICATHGFKPMHHTLQIFGICSACRDGADEAAAAQRLSQLHT